MRELIKSGSEVDLLKGFSEPTGMKQRLIDVKDPEQ
jgi:hypothetical protein